MKWSPYQEAIFDAIASGPQTSLRIEAVAGSGKTTTMVEATGRARHPKILALAFNKKIQLELEKRMPAGVVCKTLNSIGHTAWNQGRSKRAFLDTDKIYKIATELNPTCELVEAMNLARAARTVGLVPKGTVGAKGLCEDTRENWEDLADYYSCDWSDTIYEAAHEILVRSIQEARQGTIDFDDQIYMSALFGAPFLQYDIVLVDEAQDLSLVQHKMLARSLKPGAKLVAVGDSHQAIYGFRGADANSMNALQAAHSMTELPLSVSYRCPLLIVKEAQHYVSHIQSHPSAPMGQVSHWEGWGIEQLPYHCAIVCRNNAPLMELAWRLIKSGRGVQMLGRDIGNGLEKLIDKLTNGTNLPIDQFLAKLETYCAKEIARKPKAEGRTRDKCESLQSLAGGVNSSGELKRLAAEIFSNKDASITLSSIHRAKGLEWENVVFLDSYRIPSKYATQEWQITQEMNCAYIAITRAKTHLIYADLGRLKK